MKDQKLKYNVELIKKIGYDENLLDYPVLPIEENHQGHPTLRYETDKRQKVYIHSKYNIEREWERIEANLNLEDKDALYIVYGLGLGYHIKELKNKISKRSYIFVIEKNLDIVSTYMHTKNFKEISGKNILFFFGNEDMILTGISRKIFAYNVMPLLANIKNVILPAYQNIYGNWIRDMQKKIFDVIRYAYFTLGNDMEDTIIGIENNFENIDILIKSPSIEVLKDTYQNSPLIIVSAGPSLDKNIHELKNAQGKAIIIATDAVLSTLKKYEIVPDGVVSIERVHITYEKFYKDKKIHPETVFIGPPVVRREVFETMKENKKLLCLKKGEKINEWINNDILGENRLLSMGTSCAHIAFSFAKHIGANPIIFIGQDLAYTKEGITHSKDVEVLNRIDTDNHEDICFVKGIDGDLLPTDYAFKNFLTWYELEIAKDKSEIEYIDATEGGAYIEGTKLMTLKDTIKKYCNNPLTPLFKKVPKSIYDEKKYQKAIMEIEKVYEIFDKINKESDKHSKLLNNFENRYIKQKNELSQKEVEIACKHLNKVQLIERLVLNNDISRTLLQAPYIMSATKTRMLGNNLDAETIKENIIIQKKMVASFMIGCFSVMDALSKILEDLKNN